MEISGGPDLDRGPPVDVACCIECIVILSFELCWICLDHFGDFFSVNTGTFGVSSTLIYIKSE